jgi:4-diphosphocytidyl-2-C-methyl-D-erythritol kinase
VVDPVSEGWQAFPAPAKLNLLLRLVGRRADGYHLLQSVFQLLDWGDSVRLRRRSDGQIVRHAGAAGVAAEDDLSVRAARLLQAASGCRDGADIAVDKRIPMGGGFGGGSSDAATTLVALDRLWGCGLGIDRLAELGLRLGADVPLFVRGDSAWAEGVGERLIPLRLPPAWYVLVDSGVHVATAELFQTPELTRNAPPLKMADFAFDRIGDNAFTGPVRARAPRVAAILDAIATLGRGGLTGTGGGCFLATTTPEAAAEGARQLARFGRCEVVRGVDRSPLHTQLAI